VIDGESEGSELTTWYA